jgi:hypothetical protein
MSPLGRKSKFAVTAVVIFIFAIVSGYVISIQFNYSLIATVSTIFTAGIFLAAIYNSFFAERSSISVHNESFKNESAASGQNTPDSSSELTNSQQLGPTSGLRPEQKQIQNELIKTSYKEFEENPFTFRLTHQGQRLVNEVSDRLDADQSEISKVWQFCKDSEFFRKRGNAWRITPKAVFRAEELGQNIQLDDGIQEEILDALLQEYRNDPYHSRVSQDTLLGAIPQSRKVVLQNLWYLCEKRYIEREAYLGGAANYQITDLGRRILE